MQTQITGISDQQMLTFYNFSFFRNLIQSRKRNHQTFGVRLFFAHKKKNNSNGSQQSVDIRADAVIQSKHTVIHCVLFLFTFFSLRDLRTMCFYCFGMFLAEWEWVSEWSKNMCPHCRHCRMRKFGICLKSATHSICVVSYCLLWHEQKPTLE